MFGDETPSNIGDRTFYRLDTLLFDRVWSCFIKFEGHQTFDQKLKTFFLFSCLMGEVLFVWTTAYQAYLATKKCLMVFGRQTFPVCPTLSPLFKRTKISQNCTCGKPCVQADKVDKGYIFELQRVHF